MMVINYKHSSNNNNT